MNHLSAMLLCDFYKISHRKMYPPGTELVYSTWTPRASKIPDIDRVVWFGGQAFYQRYLNRFFNDHFFHKDLADILADYKRIIKNTLGETNPDTSHIEALHKLQYLPLLIKALPEGIEVPLRTPVLTIQNTRPEFFWLTNYIETLASCQLWVACTSATIAKSYRRMLDRAAQETGGDMSFVQFQGHDFSMRGMSSLESGMLSGMGHLLSFSGTDTIPAIEAAERYYKADTDSELVGTSIPASEHSIQCAYANDVEYFDKLITEVHPSGMVSIVSDGYDFWDVIVNVLPRLRNKILGREGRVVIRPDSGDPVKIVCGDNCAPEFSPQSKGAIELLWENFGGRINEKGMKELHPKIGLIYGDAITYTRAKEIIDRLKEKGFASTNIVFGIGSYTYQYQTRDTFGFALKSTLCVINGEEKFIFKDPKTDDGTKKSQKGAVVVRYSGDETGAVEWYDGMSLNNNCSEDLLRPVFLNGDILCTDSFSTIRKRLAGK